jgi:glucose-6-phosphate isomerase
MSDLNQRVWPAIRKHSEVFNQMKLVDLFENDAARATSCFVTAAGVSLDYSKNFFNEDTRALLKELCDEIGLQDQTQQLYSGTTVNNTESRAALHTLLRAKRAPTSELETEYAEVQQTLGQIRVISTSIRNGSWRGATGLPIKHVVHIGIGGSFLGPNMVDEALASTRSADDIACHYIANVDAHHITRVLDNLNAAETIVVVVSKTFSTLETKTNAETAKAWLEASLPEIGEHLIAVSTNIEAATAFGVLEGNILPMWDWVGGRYSLWSAVGLPIAIRYGFDSFQALLEGAASMDEHFSTAKPENNIPVLLAFLSTFYQHCFGAASHAVLTYDHRLRLLPDHLQQVDMESNGKSVRRGGDDVSYDTGAIIWGGEGTNGQHAFHQLLHQGTRFVGIDFIVSLKANHDLQDHHDKLVANCFSQAQALMIGRSIEDMETETSELKRAHKVMPGNRPSNTLLLDELSAASVGALIAMYEHKVFVQALFWDINPFDQWGVELGKELGQNILTAIHGGEAELDASTLNLLSMYKNQRKS